VPARWHRELALLAASELADLVVVHEHRVRAKPISASAAGASYADHSLLTRLV
jgi:hypothetical protein